MEKKESIFVRTLGAFPAVKVIDFLLENYLFDYTKAEIARETGISRVTLDIFWKEFVARRMVVEKRRIGNGIMYKLNLQSPIVKKLRELDFVISSRNTEKHLEKAIM